MTPPAWMSRLAAALPPALREPLAAGYRGLSNLGRSGGRLDLKGDRDIEWSWVAAHIPPGPGAAMDFGPGGSNLGLIAARRGYTVTAVDLEAVQWPYAHEGLRLVQGDLLTLTLPEAHFDLVLNCSAVEHVGLAGRYGVTEERPDGDLAAMARMRGLMKPGGAMLLTIPVGRDAVFAPLHRVYGRERLPRLLDGFEVAEREFWIKDEANRWQRGEEPAALDRVPLPRLYAIGCFALRRP